MFKKNAFFFILLVIMGYQSLSAQIEPAKAKDTVKTSKIDKFASKNKFFKLLRKAIFKPTKSTEAVPALKPEPRGYIKYNGKIIRDIKIITLDPFGYSETDTTRKPKNWGERFGNRIHIKSSQWAIRNYLLLKRNKPLDSLLVKESERLIRAERFANRVFITALPASKNSDSVDVFVRVLDSWTLVPKGSISSSRMSVELTERNFLGSGHEVNNRFTNRFDDGRNAHYFRYVVPNIRNSFVRTTVSYDKDLDNNYSKFFSIERPFYSPFAKWAGGIFVNQQFRRDILQNAEMQYAKQEFKYNLQDFWLGRSIRIFNGNTQDERTSNLILSGRYLRINYLETPTVEFDTIRFFSSETFYLGGLGVSSRQFIEDRYIFNNGIIEDVPIGRVYGITGGYQHKNNRGRLYLGARVTFGNYFKWGYLSTNFEYGTFFRDSKTNQSAFSFQANYFTTLYDLGKWKLRQFVKTQVLIGSNRLPSVADQLTINEGLGIQGFNSPLYGNKKIVLTLQTQTYSPWQFIGFRINPYFNYSAGVLADGGTGLLKSKVYSKIGLGILISNDYLVFNSFQLSIAYYPTIPGNGQNIFKTNTFDTQDFGLQTFDLGKPETVFYR
ncbi:MAG TPA: hypothetical protein VF677_13455 [Flavobacterium sp.]